ncbi:hypothetical protein IQ215_03575 [Cyanobacterium stanieri LEGE 03274]|uniref:Uncharacterized protein n=1 Tax=Cyanobacterium stanieri LEGE 03274 TaxID=1828756 RepID=A0ABR9V1N9_9CHRO|nr:hypothetical protein [Cyanobacterium stanieri]MBE9221767.1 hypothetical protein [Cyanobacterium stanieri LEGE 03274]
MEHHHDKKTIYLSNRSIWSNIALCFILSPIAGYIHTRRWSALGKVSLALFAFFAITSPTNMTNREAFERGQKYSLLASIISTIDNSIAIQNAKNKLKNNDSSDL